MRRHALLGTVCLLAACGSGQQRLATRLEIAPDPLNLVPLVADARNAYVVQFDSTGTASLVQVPTAGSAPTTLLSGQGASALSVDDNFLYWSDGKKVGAIPLDGGMPHVLDTRPATDSVQGLGPAGDDRLFWLVNNPDPSVSRSGLLRGYPAQPNVASQAIADFPGPSFSFATDHDALYWATFNGVFTRALGDAYGTPINRFSDSTSADVVIADGTNVYWNQLTRGIDEEIRSAPRTGGPSKLLATVSLARALAVDSHYIYWRTSNCIERAPLAGGPATEVVKVVEDAYDLAVNADSVMWIDQGALYRLPTDQIDDKAPEAGCR